MKTRQSMLLIAVSLFAALAIPLLLAAQDDAAQTNKPKKHHHYQVIDMGTFGGPNSGVPTVFDEINGTAGAQAISGQGAVAGTADTSTSDPLCYFDDCFYPNAFQWRNGTLTNLGALPGTLYSNALWTSGNGLIAGLSENGQTDPLTGLPELHGVLWQDAQISDLGTLSGGNQSAAWAVNNHGQVVGASSNGTADPYSYLYFQILGISTGTQTRAFLWDQHNGMQDLGTLGGPDAWAAFVNEQGQIAGISLTSFTPNASNGPSCAPNVPGQNPFFWEKGTGITDIGTFGGTCGVPQAMNNRGQVVGGSYSGGNTTARAFLWDRKGHPRLKDLGTLGGDNATALWIDDAGDVVGYADVSNPPGCTGLTCVHHGFLWKNGVMTDLGSIGSDPCSRALSINSRGQIVGATAAVCGGNLTHGFLWEDGGAAVDLNTLVSGADMTLTTPVYINDRGEIAGDGVLSNGDSHAFVLIPCDENHPGVEGCDYSLVEASPATGASAAPVPQRPAATDQVSPRLPGAANPMLRRFGRRLGPWYRGLGGQTPTSTLISPAPSSTEGAGHPSETVTDWINTDDVIEALGWHRGNCWVQNGVLNGYCLGSVANFCIGGVSSSCPRGARAITPRQTWCGFGFNTIDLARACLLVK